MERILRGLTICALALFPGIASAAAPRTFSELAELLISLINSGTGLLILAAFVAFFWGMSTNLLKMKDEGGKIFKNYIIWGVLALFVMISIWGIVSLLQNTLFGRGGGGSDLIEFTDTGSSFPVFGE
jgi:hypothetical protein